jgi:hypothetical protein
VLLGDLALCALALEDGVHIEVAGAVGLYGREEGDDQEKRYYSFLIGFASRYVLDRRFQLLADVHFRQAAEVAGLPVH